MVNHAVKTTLRTQTNHIKILDSAKYYPELMKT